MPAIHINRAPKRSAFHEQVNNLANNVISNIDAAKKKYDVPSSKDFPNHLVQESSSATNRNFKSSTRKLGRHNGLKTGHSSPLEIATNSQRKYVVVTTIEQLIGALNAGEKQIDIQAEIHVTDPVLKSELTDISLDSSNKQGALIFEGDSCLANNLDNCSLQNLVLQFGTVAYPTQNRDFLLANTTQSSLMNGNGIKFNVQAESELGEVNIALFNKLHSTTIIKNDIQGTVEITNDVSNARVLLAVGNSVDLFTSSITENVISSIGVQSLNPDAVINVEVCDSIADQNNCDVITTTSSSNTTSTSTTATTSNTMLSTTTRTPTTTPELASSTTDLPTTPSISGGTGAALTTGAIVGISLGTIGALFGLAAIGYIVYNKRKHGLMHKQCQKTVSSIKSGNNDNKEASVVAGSLSSSTGSSIASAVETNARTPVSAKFDDDNTQQQPSTSTMNTQV